MKDTTWAEFLFHDIDKMYDPRTIKAATTRTLYWVNTNRTKQGRKPLARLPRGVRYSIRENPVALGLGHADVGLAAVARDGKTELWFLPNAVIRFLQLFHDGYLPDLES